MRLHENTELMILAIRATARELSINEKFIEKDYWICQILQRLSRMPQAARTVWKGGTSLTKGYRLLRRFSSDVDLAIIGDGLTRSQQKKLVLRLGKDTASDLEETEKIGKPIKNSRYRRTFHLYPSVVDADSPELEFLGNHVILEINTYGNPHPFTRLSVKTFITEMMEIRGMTSMIEELDMAPFQLNVLDKRRTMCEKIVSLLRFSFEDDPTIGLSSKIRHFYDLYYLMQDEECNEYLRSDLKDELLTLIQHDKEEFDRPALWRESPIIKSPLLTDFDMIWSRLSHVYRNELGALSYGVVPSEADIASSITTLLNIIREFLK